MATDKKRVHLICNAHLDPIWLWEWPEGAATTISTFRTAVELCEQDKAFVFNHNEAILYKWVQQYEPQLFARIQKQVRAGRWNIMGGWYLQPDCNMPSGESFVRQILIGREYFKNNLGVDVTTAINFDPFGHTRGLVQIMAKSGYDSYLFGRPTKHWLEIPVNFTWVGSGGSRLTATRFLAWYNTSLGKAAEMIKRRIDENAKEDILAVLWGVGNHGGGPSRKDLKDVNRLIASSKDVQIIHSTPQAYFKELAKVKLDLPEIDKDLQPWGPGCYTSMARIKQCHRQLENDLYMTEKMVSAAAMAGLMPYPRAELDAALEDLLFAEFHDVLPGSCIQPAEQTALNLMSHGMEALSRERIRAFFALASGQKRAADGEIPVLIYNPHPFKVRGVFECEFNLPDFNASGTFTQISAHLGGKAAPTQVEQEISNLSIDWRKHVVVHAELEPGQITRLDCTLEIIPKRPAPKLKASKGLIKFRTKELEVHIDTRTGLIGRCRTGGIDYLEAGAFLPIVMNDNSDSWGSSVRRFEKIAGKFRLLDRAACAKFCGLEGKLQAVRVIEDGYVRSVVEVIMGFEESFICMRYKLPKIGTEIEIEVRVIWNQKDKMLKLKVPVKARNCDYLCQTAYGVSTQPNNGDEAVGQKWTAVVSKSDNKALTVINDCIYGSDYSPAHGLRLTLLRSPAYASNAIKNRIPRNDRFTPRMDQGEHVYHFWINSGPVKERLEAVDREALVKNEKPMAVSFFPNGSGKKPAPWGTLDDKVLQVTAFKQTQEGKGYIARLFNPTNSARSAMFSLGRLRNRIRVELGPYEIKTLRINDSTGAVREVNLLEK